MKPIATLNEFPLRRLHIDCVPCDRTGRYDIDRAISRHGPDFPMQAFIDLVTGCPRRRLPADHPDRCKAGSYDFIRLASRAPTLRNDSADWRKGHGPRASRAENQTDRGRSDQ